MILSVYGIPNCTSVRKARKYLEDHHIDYDFINLRDTPPESAKIKCWLATFDTALVNKRSSTYRNHSEEAKTALEQGEEAIIALLRAHPTMIKRPIIEYDDQPLIFGFDEADLAELVAQIN